MIHIEVSRGDDSMSIEVDEKETAMELIEQFFEHAENKKTSSDIDFSRYEPPQTSVFEGPDVDVLGQDTRGATPAKQRRPTGVNDNE